jgi:CheY-like chemotaxis protein
VKDLGLRILVVDDEPTSVQPLCAELGKSHNTTVTVVGFDDFQNAIERFAPQIIVLDLARGSAADKDAPGIQTFEDIWQKRFCPLVVYTAVPDLLGDEPRLTHPFIKLQKKGSGSEERVIEHIREFGPHLSALDEAGAEVGLALNRALKDVARRIFDNVKEPGQRKEMLVRSARRRVAAAMDKELSTGGPNLRSWEHYLCPPTNAAHLLTGDLIKKTDGRPEDPSQYAIVLTPSCDLVVSEHRKPKVEKVLVAMCTTVARLLDDLGLAITTKPERIREGLLPILTQGHGGSSFPLPGLPGEFPAMAADFRNLELIGINDIGDAKRPWIRIASVDNPFRELVAWAYITNAARPGLPERDFGEWADEIIAGLPRPATKP